MCNIERASKHDLGPIHKKNENFDAFSSVIDWMFSVYAHIEKD